MSKELMVQPLSIRLQPKLNKAKAIALAWNQEERNRERASFNCLLYAWQLGECLCQLKEELRETIGHGSWLIWLPPNFPELGNAERTIINNAERAMRLFRENPNSSNPRNFTIDSTRKFSWLYVPPKDRPQLEGDSDINPGPHHLTFVNQFSKWDRQFRNGHVEEFELEMFRHETAPMIRRIAELGGREWATGLVSGSG